MLCNAMSLFEQFEDSPLHLVSDPLYQNLNRKLAKSYNFIPNPVALSTVENGKYIFINNAFLDTLNYSTEEILGKTGQEINLWANPIDGAKVTDQLRRDTSVRGFITQVRKKSGGLVEIALRAELIKINRQKYYLSSFIEITGTRTFEKEMARLDRLNLVGDMATAIGHEIRNPLTTVRGYLQMYQRKTENAKYHSQFQTMIEEIDRANAVISEFLSLAQNKAVELKPNSLNDIIRTLLPLLQAEALRSGQDIQVDMGDVPDINLDEKEIRQLLLNLVRNGFEAMEVGGRIVIETYAVNDKVVLAVHDTGKGIPQKVLDKIGTPFVTTKDNGTGLGLPVCYRIAQRHEANIDVKTSPQGTIFMIEFKMGARHEPDYKAW